MRCFLENKAIHGFESGRSLLTEIMMYLEILAQIHIPAADMWDSNTNLDGFDWTNHHYSISHWSAWNTLSLSVLAKCDITISYFLQALKPLYSFLLNMNLQKDLKVAQMPNLLSLGIQYTLLLSLLYIQLGWYKWI